MKTVADIGPIEDLPVLKVAATAKADAARANAAQGTGDAGQLAPGMKSRESDPSPRCRRLPRRAPGAFRRRGGRPGTLRTRLLRRCCDSAE